MTDIREALEAAMDSTASTPEPEKAVETATPEPVQAESPEPVETKADRARAPDGKFAKAEPKLEAKTPAPAPAVETKTPAPAPQAATTESYKAPQSWKPGVREKWAALPPEVQAEVARVDREVRQTMQEAAEHRKLASEFRSTVAPYEGMLRAEGIEPVKAVASLLQTFAALRTAPPQHKAQMLANMVKNFGVPIEALDAALVGQPQQQQAQAPYRDPRVDQLMAEIESAKAARGQQLQATVQQEIGQFAEKEFFEDVREDIADILEMNAKRGVAMTLEEAYNRACRIHPEVSRALSQREAAKQAATATAATQQAKRAASSIKSSPSGGVGKEAPSSIRDLLESGFDR